MKKTILAALIGLALAAPAFGTNNTPAAQGGNASAIQGQTQEQTAVGVGVGVGIGVGGKADSASSSNAAAAGGAGGYAVGIGGTGYSYSVNTPTAEGGKVENSGNSTATGGSSRQSQGQSNVGNTTGQSNVTVQGDEAQKRAPVSSAIGSTIVTGSDQCLIPVSGGGQAVGFGISIGSAVPDKICEGLKLARQLDAFGFREQAVKLLKALDPRVAAAFE